MSEGTSKKSVFKKWWFWLIAIIIVVTIVNKDKKGNAANETVATSNTAKETKTVYKIGSTVKFDDCEWLVESSKDLGKTLSSDNQFIESASTDGKFILVKFKITNLTNKEERIVDAPKIIDSKSREFKDFDKQLMYIPKDGKTLSLDALPSNISKTFYAIYEVPADAKELQFTARALSAFGETQLVTLGL